MVDYWSKLEITDCWSEKERFNFVMGKIEEAIVGDSSLAERINEVISDLENIYIPVKVSDLENDVGYINEHQSLDEYVVKSDEVGLIRNDGSIDSSDYVVNDDLNDVIRVSDEVGLIRNDGSVDNNVYLTGHQDISGKANSSDLSTVALSGSYTDLIDTPTIPSKISDLENDSDFLTEHQSLDEYIVKSNIDGLLRNDGSIDTNLYLTSHQDISMKVNSSDLSTIATTGNYEDLNNAPDIPTKLSDLTDDKGYLTQHQSLENYISKSNEIGLVKNDGTIDKNSYLTQHQDISMKVDRDSLSDVALSGEYVDLENKPYIPVKVSDLDNDSGYLTEHQDISGKINRTELFRNGVFETTNTNSRGSVAKIWNESDGGGTQFTDNSSGVVSFVGVNEGSRDGDIYVQVYSKVKSTNTGVRLNFNPTGAYYTVGNSKTWTSEDEIATKKDINQLVARVEELEQLLNGTTDAGADTG